MKLGRRTLLAMVPALAACRRAEPDHCEDVAADPTRTTLAYTDASKIADQTCASCKQFVEPRESGACGGCSLVKGPIHPRGWCKAYAPKA